jgi:futalosine hydrolase
MKKILLVSATSVEISPLLKTLKLNLTREGSAATAIYKDIRIDVLVTGVGMVATTFHLARTLYNEKYELVINAGIAGSFSRYVPLGSVLNITSEEFPEMGAEAGEKFLNIFELGLQDKDRFPFQKGRLINDSYDDLDYKTLKPLSKVHGITVNKVHGSDESIAEILSYYKPITESMEGGAFFYCCIMNNVPCVQLRGISNFVEKRNRGDWNIDLAVQNLNKTLMRLVEEAAAKAAGTDFKFN